MSNKRNHISGLEFFTTLWIVLFLFMMFIYFLLL